MNNMKTGIGMRLFVLLIVLSTAPLFAQQNSMNGSSSNVTKDIEAIVQGIEAGTLSSAEEAGILLMREEEKLARDVYLTLYEKWNIPVFANIAASEASHMDAMELLIERYGLGDPVEDESAAARGSYQREEFEELYSELTAQGLASYQKALEVGTFIEDLDIADLQKLISESGNADVKVVYQNLVKGSRNHLRAFARQLERYDGEYDPQYISIIDYQKIITSRNEAGVITDPDFSF
ncbi:MAG TPA: DUF2202 domain-containing protein [Clostridia bacterium]|nr:DUF2202 domain-containing protein [Clostridia bacterium]